MKNRISCLICRRIFWTKVYPVEITLELENILIKNLKTNEEVLYPQIKNYLPKETCETIEETVEVMKKEKMKHAKIKVCLASLCLNCKNKLRQRRNLEKRNPKSVRIISDSN